MGEIPGENGDATGEWVGEGKFGMGGVTMLVEPKEYWLGEICESVDGACW